MIGIGIGLSIGSGRRTGGGGPAPVDPADFIIGDGELGAILALGSAALNGKVIAGEPGADIIGTSAGDSVTFASTLSIPDGLTIRSVDPANPCFLRRMVFQHDGPLTFQNVVIRDYFAPATDLFGLSGIMRIATPGDGRSGLRFIDCEIYSDDPEGYDDTILLSGTGTASSSGNTVTFTGSPDLSGIPDDRTVFINIAGINRTITAVDNAAKTVSITPTLTIGASNWKIAYVPQTLRGLQQDGGAFNRPDLYMLHCRMHDYDRALTGQFRDLQIIESDFDRAYADHLSIGVNGAETRYDVLRCTMRRAFGLSTHPANPHVDGLQIDCGAMTVDNSIPYNFIGNILWAGPGGLAKDLQGIFLENIPSDRRILARIEHNVYLGRARNAITVERPAAGASIRGNTALFDASTVGPAGLTPQISTVSGAYPTGDLSTVYVEHNVAAIIGASSATTNDNYAFGGSADSNTAAIYAGLFAGIAGDFNSDNLASAAALRAALTPDTTTLWPVGRTRIGAMSGYYDYLTGVSDNPWDEDGWDASGAWGDLSDVPVGDPVVSTKRQVTGVSETGVTVRVIGGETPSLTLYDTDGTTVIVSGVSSVLALNNQYIEIHDTGSGTGETLSTVTISAGSGASGSWQFETEAAGYLINAVVFDGTNDWMFLETGFSGGAGGKTGLIAFNVYCPSAWIASGALIGFANSGGSAQALVSFAASGAMGCVLRNASNTVVGSFSTATGTFVADTWYTVLVGWDTATQTWQIYRRPSGGSWAAPTLASSSLTLDAITAAITRCRIGTTNSTGAGRPAAEYWLADVWGATNQYLDLSISGNRDKFLPTAEKGSDGSIPTGTAPALFLSGATSTWHTNDGSGGGLTLTGALTTASSVPS